MLGSAFHLSSGEGAAGGPVFAAWGRSATGGFEADASRLRLILEGSRAFEGDEGRTLTPSVELGLRHDGGDAETGTGLEAGAGIRYAGAGLTVEGARTWRMGARWKRRPARP